MNRRAARALSLRYVALAALVLAGGCGRSPDPRLYTLMTRSGTHTYPAQALVVEVRRPSIAGYLDRREIVRGVTAQQLELASGALWAEPLATMIGRVLASDLAQRLPQSQVVTEQGALAARPDVRVEIDVQRFEQDRGALVLEAQVSVRDGSATEPRLSRVALSTQSAASATGALVAAMNDLLARLADHIAHTVVASRGATREARAEAAPVEAP